MDISNIAGSTLGYTLPHGICEISELTLLLKFLFPNEVKVKILIDVRLRSNLITNKTIKFTIKQFFYTLLGFTQLHSGP